MGPRAKLHWTGLLIEGEISNVNSAFGLEDRRGQPSHGSFVSDDYFGVDFLVYAANSEVSACPISNKVFCEKVLPTKKVERNPNPKITTCVKLELRE